MATEKVSTRKHIHPSAGAIESTRRQIAGSAQDLQKKALEKLDNKPGAAAFDPFEFSPLSTVSHGREYAIAFLRYLDGLGVDEDKFSAVKEGREPLDGSKIIYRTGPQSPMVRDTFDNIYNLAEPARAGFFQIMTEAIAGGCSGWGENFDRGDLEKIEGKIKQSDAEKKAAEALSKIGAVLFSLHDIALRLPTWKCSSWTFEHCVMRLAGSMRGTLDDARSDLTPKHSKARKHIEGASSAIEALKELTKAINGDDGDFVMSKAAASLAMLGVVQRIGREVDSAMLACHAPFDVMGYLDRVDFDPQAVVT